MTQPTACPVCNCEPDGDAPLTSERAYHLTAFHDPAEIMQAFDDLLSLTLTLSAELAAWEAAAACGMVAP